MMVDIFCIAVVYSRKMNDFKHFPVFLSSIFDKIRGVWIADKTLSRVIDISSQSKQKLWSKRRNKSYKSMLIKTG